MKINSIMSATSREPGQHQGKQNETEKMGTSSTPSSEETPDSRDSHGSLIAFSDSLFFPTSSDAIWESSAIIPDNLLDGNVSGLDDESDDESPLDVGKSCPVFDRETSDEDNLEGHEEQQEDTGEDENTQHTSPWTSETALLQLQLPTSGDWAQSQKDGGAPLPAVISPVQGDEMRVPSSATVTQSPSGQQNTSLPSSSAVTQPPPCRQDTGLVPRHLITDKEECSPQLASLHQQMAQLNLPGPDADIKELEEKFDSGLRLLDELAHAGTSDEKELKRIHDAYYNFAQALFQDIKEPSRLMKSTKVEGNGSDVGSNSLEQQKEEIAEQERLLEKEILHYKATKLELKKIAEELEEASKSYRKPEILEDVVIPKDIKLSSSSEYVAEIEELQEEILKKQETLKEIRKEIRHRLLPKSLVDSVCESHRLAMQSLRDIEEENAYLKECISRLDLKYLYNLQIS